eukprot:1052083-Rhodomonas_salina.1
MSERAMGQDARQGAAEGFVQKVALGLLGSNTFQSRLTEEDKLAIGDDVDAMKKGGDLFLLKHTSTIATVALAFAQDVCMVCALPRAFTRANVAGQAKWFGGNVGSACRRQTATVAIPAFVNTLCDSVCAGHGLLWQRESRGVASAGGGTGGSSYAGKHECSCGGS